MSAEFQQAAQLIYEEARKEGRLIENPSERDLRAMTLQTGARETSYGNIAAESEPTSRAAMFTRNNIDSRFDREEWELLQQAERCLRKEKIVSLDVEVGDGSEGITARLMVPERFAQVGYGGRKLFKPIVTERPTHQVIMFFDEEHQTNEKKPLPEKDIMIRIVHLPNGETTKIVRNSNYTGEWKKGVFAAEDWRVKQGGKAIFLHAGCRQDFLEMAHGGYQIQNSLFVALSANGKTSLVSQVLARKGSEESWLIQDDGGSLASDGSFHGFEAGGVFVKTDGLSPGDQREIFYGVLKPNSYLENVGVSEEGEIDFYNIERTANGRAIVERRDFMHTSREITVERVHNLFIIARGNILPAMAKLTPEQATAFMVLGQSMESSAGDPTRAGEIRNVFFYDPFVAGERAEHANLFYEILKENDISCYLLNTGGIGEGTRYHNIRIQDTLGILDSTLRGGLENWVLSEGTGLMVPKSVRTVDSILFHPRKLYSSSGFEERQKALNKQRAGNLERYPGLNKKIKAVFKE